MTHAVVPAVRAAMRHHACAADAKAVQEYMKSDQPFYGVKSPLRRRLLRETLKTHPIRTEAEYEAAIRTLWKGKHRDDQYLALDIAERYKEYRTPERWPLFEGLLRSAAWWDTVDWIASKLLGDLLEKDRSQIQDVRAWAKDGNVWVRRASLLVHLKHKQDTDLGALAAAIDALQDEESFWIRKAIGWVLRVYGDTDPDWVRGFVDAHPGLSALSKREALKHL